MIRVVFSALFFVFCAASLHAGNLQAWFDYKVYQLPDGTPYVETHMNFKGLSLEHRAINDSTDQAQVSATIIIKQGSDIIDFKKLTIDGPQIPTGYYQDFMDVQRFLIKNGAYIVEIELNDVFDPTQEPETFSQPLMVSNPKDQCFVSDIMLVQAYAVAAEQSDLSKSGYDMLPYVDNYFPSDFNDLIFYTEVYNANMIFGDDSLFALVAYIESNTSGKIAANQQVIRRSEAKDVVPMFQTFDISELSSGDYDLVIEVRNRGNQPVASQRLKIKRNKFQGEGPPPVDVTRTFVANFESRDSIMPHIRSFTPTASTLEVKAMHSIVLPGDLTIQQKYFYNFWVARNPLNPEQAWNEYYREVVACDREFGTQILEGWETDQGRVYLKYGKPNTRVERPHISELHPYEIWHYYSIANTNDKRFLFYAPSGLATSFVLLHSDLLGETQNFGWRTVMMDRNNPLHYSQQDNLDQNKNTSFERSELEDLFFNPR
jgi:GWxTD domain-containing protein